MKKQDGYQEETFDKPYNDEQNADEVEVVSSPYEQYTDDAAPSKSKKFKASRNFLVIIVIVLVVLLGAAVYWKLFRSKSVAKPNITAPVNQPTTLPVAFSTTTKHYSSSTFRLAFDYPEDWVVNDSSSGQLILTSSSVTLAGANGQSQTGKVTLNIRSKQLPMDEFKSGNATAAHDSEKLSYAKPSAVQRGQTYISFLRYANSSAGELVFNGIYITGDTGYKKDQAIPKADFVPIDPIIYITFHENCSGNDCPTGGASLPVASSNWDNSSFSGPLKAMLQSLVIN